MEIANPEVHTATSWPELDYDTEWTEYYRRRGQRYAYSLV